MGQRMPEPGHSLETAATTAVEDVLDAQADEEILIVTNPSGDVHQISKALADAFRSIGAEPDLLVQEPKSQFDFADDEVLEALHDEPDIALSISQDKLGKDPKGVKEPYEGEYDSIYQYLIGSGRSRGFWSPGVTTDTFQRAVPIDYEWLRSTAAALKSKLDAATEVRVTTEAGTDISFGVEGRSAFVDDGDFREPGSGGNLPAGESYVSPELGSADGKIVVDGAVATVDGGTFVPDEPVTIVFERGFVAMIDGGEGAERFEDDLTRGAELAREWGREDRLDAESVTTYAKNASHLGEFGIGLNRSAEIVGNLLEDEKVYRTCHLAVGSNYDNDAPALIHLDLVLNEPTVEARAKGRWKPIVESGELAI